MTTFDFLYQFIHLLYFVFFSMSYQRFNYYRDYEGKRAGAGKTKKQTKKMQVEEEHINMVQVTRETSNRSNLLLYYLLVRTTIIQKILEKREIKLHLIINDLKQQVNTTFNIVSISVEQLSLWKKTIMERFLPLRLSYFDSLLWNRHHTKRRSPSHLFRIWQLPGGQMN